MKRVEIRNVVECDGSPRSIAHMLVGLVREICMKSGKDPAEGTAILMLAAMQVYHRMAKDPDRMAETLPLIVKQMASEYLKELEGARH